MKCNIESPAVLIVKCILSVLILCAVAVAIYGIRRLYMNQDKQFIIKRAQWLIHDIIGSNLAVTSALLSTLIVIPMRCFDWHTDLIIHTECHLCWFTITLCLNVKYFLFLLRGKKHHFAIRTEWQQLINPDVVKVEENWYIRNQHRFNTLPSTYSYFGCFHFTLFILCESSYIYTHHIHGANGLDLVGFLTFKSVESLLFLIPFLSMVLIGKLILNPEDPHCIRWERQITIKLVAFLCALLLTANWKDSIRFFHSENTQFVDPTIELLIFAALRVLVLFGIVMTNTFGLIYRNNADDRQLMLHTVSSNSDETEGKDTSPSAPASARGSDADMLRITLDMVLSNGKALDLLMHHLEKEYSMEVLLSYIELDQFQKYVLKIADEFLRDNLLATAQSFSPLCTPGTPPGLLLGPGTTGTTGPTTPLGTPPEDPVGHSNSLQPIPEKLAKTQTSPVFPEFEPTETRRRHSDPRMRYSDLQNIPDLGITVMNTVSGVPKSEILMRMCSISSSRGISLDRRTLHDIKMKAHLLYNKYVKCGSPFEVNVSYEIRSGLQRKLDDKEMLMKDENVRLADLIQIFDEVKQAMRHLLRPPFRRMKLGPDLSTLKALFGSEIQVTTQ